MEFFSTFAFFFVSLGRGVSHVTVSRRMGIVGVEFEAPNLEIRTVYDAWTKRIRMHTYGIVGFILRERYGFRCLWLL